jgi:alpha-beta hydrolase superfamily lysophospholipase
MHICLEASHKLHFSYPQDITFPIRVFAGTLDAVLPIEVVEEWVQHAKAQNVELIRIEGGTHDGIVHTHKEPMLEHLAADIAAAGFSSKLRRGV